jgi:hypothetical protein
MLVLSNQSRPIISFLVEPVTHGHIALPASPSACAAKSYGAIATGLRFCYPRETLAVLYTQDSVGGNQVKRSSYSDSVIGLRIERLES